jgi:hypothetical protein
MSYTWVKTFIEDLTLQPNGRLRMDCPSCQKKNTLSVSDDGYRRMYNCFSANCDVKGVTNNRLTTTNSRVVFEKKSEPSIKHKVSDFQLPSTFVPLSRSQKAIDYVRSVNSYQAYLDNRVDIMYDIRFDRVSFLVKNKGRVVDAVGKSLSNGKPKWYRYGSSHYPFLCGRGDVACVVEDCPSACSVSFFCKGLALLGTNLLDSHLDILKSHKKVIVALDKDATNKAVEMSRKISQYVNCSVAFLTNDLKNLEDKDRERFVRKYIN